MSKKSGDARVKKATVRHTRGVGPYTDVLQLGSKAVHGMQCGKTQDEQERVETHDDGGDGGGNHGQSRLRCHKRVSASSVCMS